MLLNSPPISPPASPPRTLPIAPPAGPKILPATPPTAPPTVEPVFDTFSPSAPPSSPTAEPRAAPPAALPMLLAKSLLRPKALPSFVVRLSSGLVNTSRKPAPKPLSSLMPKVPFSGSPDADSPRPPAESRVNAPPIRPPTPVKLPVCAPWISPPIVETMPPSCPPISWPIATASVSARRENPSPTFSPVARPARLSSFSRSNLNRLPFSLESPSTSRPSMMSWPLLLKRPRSAARPLAVSATDEPIRSEKAPRRAASASSAEISPRALAFSISASASAYFSAAAVAGANWSIRARFSLASACTACDVALVARSTSLVDRACASRARMAVPICAVACASEIRPASSASLISRLVCASLWSAAAAALVAASAARVARP